MVMDLKAAPSDTLERTLLLAWARPAQHTQVCLRGSHTRTLARRGWNLLGVSATHHVPHPCWVNREEPSPTTKKTCLSLSSLPRLLHSTNTQQAECLSTSPTMNLRNLQHPCLRSPTICTRVPASFASPVFAHNSSHAPPSQDNPPHSTLGQKTTQALPNDDAVTDTTTDGQERNGRDLTVRVESSTLGLRPSHLGKLSLPAHSSRAVISRWPT